MLVRSTVYGSLTPSIEPGYGPASSSEDPLAGFDVHAASPAERYQKACEIQRNFIIEKNLDIEAFRDRFSNFVKLNRQSTCYAATSEAISTPSDEEEMEYSEYVEGEGADTSGADRDLLSGMVDGTAAIGTGAIIECGRRLLQKVPEEAADFRGTTSFANWVALKAPIALPCAMIAAMCLGAAYTVDSHYKKFEETLIDDITEAKNNLSVDPQTGRDISPRRLDEIDALFARINQSWSLFRRSFVRRNPDCMADLHWKKGTLFYKLARCADANREYQLALSRCVDAIREYGSALSYPISKECRNRVRHAYWPAYSMYVRMRIRMQYDAIKVIESDSIEEIKKNFRNSQVNLERAQRVLQETEHLTTEIINSEWNIFFSHHQTNAMARLYLTKGIALILLRRYHEVGEVLSEASIYRIKNEDLERDIDFYSVGAFIEFTDSLIAPATPAS